MKLEVGQRVRVSEHVIMYHKPGMKNQEVDIHGMEGVIIADASLYDGEEIISATAPYIVKFDENPKFKAHLTEEELQVI